MKTVSDIMISNVLSVKDTDSIHHARMILKDKDIRHLPVVDSLSNDYLGVLTQGGLLNHAFKIVEKYGMSYLEKRERQTPVNEVMTVDCETATADMDLISVGQYFTLKKTSCLPVLEGKTLIGIITSVDFVKLSLHLLSKK